MLQDEISSIPLYQRTDNGVLLYEKLLKLNKQPDKGQIIGYLELCYENMVSVGQTAMKPNMWLSEGDWERYVELVGRVTRKSMKNNSFPLSVCNMFVSPLVGLFSERLDRAIALVDWDDEERRLKFQFYNDRKARKGVVETESQKAYGVYMEACRKRKEVREELDKAVREAWEAYQQISKVEHLRNQL